jgi:hypothetical protein
MSGEICLLNLVRDLEFYGDVEWPVWSEWVAGGRALASPQ